MGLNNDYTFTISVSAQTYRDRDAAKAGCSTITFQQMELNPDSFLSLAKTGHAFCYHFKNNQRRKEGHFLDTEVVFFDIDYPSVDMNTFIQDLPFKPTMGYTTYRNNPDESFYRFRLIYGFDSPIKRQQDFDSIYDAIADANGFRFALDDLDVNQLYFGSNSKLAGFQEYNSSHIYSYDDFQEYIQEPREETVISTSTDSLIPQTHIYNDERNDTITDEERHNYYKNYIESLETKLIEAPTHTHYTYPDEYYAVPIRIITQDGKRVIKKWHDGERRRQKLYISALIMLRNVPTLTPDNLSFNLWQLMGYYYDNRKDKITKDDIDGIVERAFERRYTYNLQPTEHKGTFRINKGYWAKLDITPRQAVPLVMKERNMSVMDYYDPSLSIVENYNKFLEMDLDIGYNTLCRYVNDLGLKRDLDAEIIELMLQMPDITVEDLATALGKSTSTIKRHIKGLKEGDQPRVRRIKKQWVVQEETENAYPVPGMPS